MNAVIALCHFCEAHGPCPIFCTQTLRDTKIEELKIEAQIQNNDCPACNSIGAKNPLISKDNESNANFLSIQSPVLPEVAALVKQASVRSLSCEITSNKDGGIVFFGDASRGHVLSHTFHISDAQARGFYQLYSIIILMKDKYFLLNIQPFLSENLKKVSKELQNYAQNVYDSEQASGSIREKRLLGTQSLTQTPRSLIELTGEKNIFPIIHSHFTWILLAGSRFLTEQVTFGSLPWLPLVNEKITKSSEKEVETTFNNSREPEQSPCSIRLLRDILKTDFTAACYCIITGIKVIIRGPLTKCHDIFTSCTKLLPEQMHNLLKFNSPKDVVNPDCRIVVVSPEVAVPVPNSDVFRIDILEDNISIKWQGELPSKWPDLLNKIIKAFNNDLFNDFVLDKHLKVLIEEWKNKIICINRVRRHSDAVKLKQILGIQQQDQNVVNYWSKYF